MEKYNLQNDLKVFGLQVKTFPNGVGEAFDQLMKTLPNGNERPYYGISYCTDGNVTYIAAAPETFDDEGSKYGYQNYSIQKGEYLTAPLTDWTSKTHCIKDVFAEIIKDERVDKTQPAIEVYKNMKEMVCMVKLDQRKEMHREFDKVMNEMIVLLSSLSDEQINIRPSVEKWSAGQLSDHILQSHTGFLKIINGPVKETERDPGQWIGTIKKDFADFSIKTESPEFVRPKKETYEKEDVLRALHEVKSSIDNAIKNVDLTKTCSLFELPIYGYLTTTEAIWFVISHTQRHVHQLKSIIEKVK